MYAQILVGAEMDDLAVRVTDSVVTVLADLAGELTDPELRSAMRALVVAAHEHLTHEPIDTEPLVRSILRGEPAVPFAVPVPVEVTDPSRPTAPAYWPAVPEISDQLFAEYAANGPKKQDEGHAGDSPAAGPELDQVHHGRFHPRSRRRRKKSTQR
jgi:hypothetical protein